jgi:uncharacterized membrane protein
VLVIVAGLTYAWRLYVTGPLLAFLTGVLAVSLINPLTLMERLGPELFWNQAMYGYGAGIVALVIAGLILDLGCRGKLTSAPRDRALPQSMFALAAILTAALACVLVRYGFSQSKIVSPTSLWLELSTDFIAVALVGLALAAIARTTAEPWLERLANGFLVAALAAMIVLGGLLFGPLTHPVQVGQSVLLNWISFAFGLPILVGAIALFLHKDRSSPSGNLVRVSLCAATAVFLFMHVRHWFWVESGTMMIRGMSSFHICEFPTYALILGAISGVAEWLHRQSRSEPMWQAAVGLAAGFGALVFLVITAFNPLVLARDVGAFPVVNWLLYIFGAPLAASVWLAVRFRESQRMISMAASSVALFLLWLLVTAEVRQYFVGGTLTGPAPTQSEWYAYSAAWIALAIGLLIAGVAGRSHVLRWASLVLMLASVAKVFLFDTRQLGDLWRVASYFGLGVSLMLVAFVYQRFVFRESRGRVGELP